MAKVRRRSRERLDLNLVRTLEALLAERNVTRAAARVGLTQSAASHALQRLRDHFGDPLLVRTAGGMTLTARAAAMVAPVRDGLQLIERAVDDGRDFDPETARRTFTLAMTDYLGELLLPEVHARIAAAAPGIDLRVVSIVEDVERTLETEDVDLVLSMAAMRDVPANLYSKRLFEEPYACVVRAGHPLLDGTVTLERYCEAAHLLVAPRGGRGVIDRLLAERGLARRIAIQIPHFSVAPHLVAGSDLVLTVVERLARRFAELLALSVFAPPLAIPPVPCAALWHARSHHDPGHAWLRALVATASRARGSRKPAKLAG